MTKAIPWITRAEESKCRVSPPIDVKALIQFLELEQTPEGFYNSLEETFWAVLGLLKMGKFPETRYKDLISFIQRHRMASGGYSNKLERQYADAHATFYAIALFSLVDVFKDRLTEETLFCPECGQKQLIPQEVCFNCDAQLVSDKFPCILCNTVVYTAANQEPLLPNLCDTCVTHLKEDISFLLQLQTKKGIKHCELDNCIVCKGRPSYQSAFYVLNTLKILKSIDQLDLKITQNFLKRNQYLPEVELVFQILCYCLLDQSNEIDFQALIQSLLPFQFPNGGFGFGKKVPVVSETFWSLAVLEIFGSFDFIQLGGIYTFLLGLKRNDGGYSEQLMDTISSIRSTIQAYLLTLTILNPLVEQVENEFLRRSASDYKIYLAPIAEKFGISSDLVESIAYQLLSNDWFSGKILDQLDFFNDYLDESPKITHDIGKSLIQLIQNQNITELNLSEFSKRFAFENAEERVKTTLLDFISRKFIEGEIKELKKTFKRAYIVSGLNLPRKFLAISLDTPIPVDKVFKEKTDMEPAKQDLISSFNALLTIPAKIEGEIQETLTRKAIKHARDQLKHGVQSFKEELTKYEAKLTAIQSEFKYIDFRGAIIDILEDWPINKKAIFSYLIKFQTRMTNLINEEEKSKAYEDKLTEEERLIVNFERDLQLFIDKMELLTQNFQKHFQQNYMSPPLAEAKIKELEQNLSAFSNDVKEKEAQFKKSISLSDIPTSLIDLQQLLDTKTSFLKSLIDESQEVLKEREALIKKIESNFLAIKQKLSDSQTLIREKIEKKEFDAATAAIENLDETIRIFDNTLVQSIEAKIKSLSDSFTQFVISFSDIHTVLQQNLKRFHIEWAAQKEGLLYQFHERSELAKKNELQVMMRKFISTETGTFEAIKTKIETLIKHENIPEAKLQLQKEISEYIQRADAFSLEISNSVKQVTKTYKNFKKMVTSEIFDWEKEKNFILESMQTLANQLANLSVEKDLLAQKNKLDLIIKNQKLLLSKQFSNLLKLYFDALDQNSLLAQEHPLTDVLNELLASTKKASIQINGFLRENTKKFSNFGSLAEPQMGSWETIEETIKKTTQKLQDNLTENLLIERIYFIIKAFEGKKAEIKYLAKNIRAKSAHLKDTLVHLLSRSRLDGTLDPINDILTINTLKPIAEDTKSFLRQIQEEIGRVLQIDFSQKDTIPKEIDDFKQYLQQLRYLLVIHRQVGATLFHRQFGTWDINPDLISGFLSAIQSFSSEIKSKAVPIKKMAYKEFEIVLNQGEQVLVALIVDDNSSDWHEQKVAVFTSEFEEQFRQNLQSWSGELTQFKTAGLMIDRVFELYRAYI